MTRPLDRHLDGDEVDALVTPQATGVPVAGQLSEEAIREAQRHVEACQDCDRKVQMHRSAQKVISQRAMRDQKAKRPNCSDESEWVKVAAGLFDETEAKERMKHAAQCGYCGPLLKSAAKTLSDETTPEEEVVLAKLGSAGPEWQAQMARTLRNAGESQRPQEPAISFWKSFFYWPRPAFAAAVLAVLVCATWVGVRILRPPSAERLLAQAYTKHRTIEVRVPEAQYAPLRIERSGPGSNIDKPESLLRAEALISEGLRRNPNDPRWLQAKARADLLDGNYDSAIKTLQHALETEPNSPQLLADLGSAYYMRGESADRPIDYGNAIEALGQALAGKPDDSIAIFNRALACEKSFLYTQAMEDWQHYLRLDPQGDWAEEARKHLTAIEEKVKQHAQGVAEPLLTPAEIARRRDDSALADKIDTRVEEYLTAALLDWLPRAYPANPEPKSPEDFRQALRILSAITVQKHGDQWLSDLLSGSAQPSFPTAVEHLSEAIKANDTGDNVAARRHAAEAARLFASEDSAGALRARVEYMFASQDAQDGQGCLKAARGLDSQLEAHPYPWLKTQYLIESGNCTWILGNLGDVQRFFLYAAREAELGRYAVIYLRTQDHLSLLAGEFGDLPGAWARNQKALASYWSGIYPAMRGYNLYYDRYEFADSTQQPHLKMAALRDGLVLTETFEDNLLRAMAHSFMGNAAIESGQPQIAGLEFTRSSQLFAASPQIESTQIARLEAETRLAAVEISQNNGQQAVAYLRDRISQILQHPTNYLSILFYTTLGEAESQAGHTKEADSALRVAVTLADKRLESLRDDKSRLEWGQQSSSAYRHLVQQQLLQGDSQGALEIWEWYRGAELRAGVSQNTAHSGFPQLNEVATRIPDLTGETVISYAVLPRGLAVFVYDDHGVASNWVEGDLKTIQAQVKRFRELCSDATAEQPDVERNGRALYRLLIAPLEGRIYSKRALVIEADDEFAEIPFEALVDEQGRYLGDRVVIVASPGLYYRSDAAASVPITTDSAAIIVAVQSSQAAPDSPVVPLPDALEEGEAVAHEFQNVRFIRGNEATASAVALGLQSAAIFHFVGHAMASSHHSGLLLSDSFLNGPALRRISVVKLHLAVLSACDTQGGFAGGAADADDLVRVFLAVGVPNVVASRWSVDSAATRQFMQLFYRALLGGSSTAESIQRAQAALRSQPGMSHPYYWSAFTAFGAV